MQREQPWPTTRITLLSQLRNPLDEPAWRMFVDLYLPLIYGYSRRRGLQDADAQNVAQEVLTRVSRAIRTLEYDPTRGRFRGWLGLITHQQLLRHHHKERATLRGIGAGVGDELCNEVTREVEGVWIEAFNAHVYRCARQQVRQEFDPDTWQVFEEVWECGRSPQEVAADMCKKPEWVYQAKFKVLQRVKEEVTRMGADEIVFGRLR